MTAEPKPVQEGSEGGSQGVELTRDMTYWQVAMLGVGALIGAGVFVLIGSAAGEAGPAMTLAFVLNGVIVMLTAMVYAELGSALPSAGGSYVYVKQGLPPAFSFMAGWLSWFAISVAGALYAHGFGSFTVEFLRIVGYDLESWAIFESLRHIPGLSQLGIHFGPNIIVGIFIVGLFLLINYRGASETGAVGLIISASKVAVILVFAAAGIWALLNRPDAMQTFQPFSPEGLSGVVTAMGLTYIAFEGAEVMVQTSEEVVEPKKNIPMAIFTAVAIVVTVYLLVSVALMGGINPPAGYEGPVWEWLGGLKELGLAEAAKQVLPYGNFVILLGGLLSTTSALNAAIYSSSRISFAMGRDRFLPPWMGKISQLTRTPWVAILGSGVLVFIVLVALPLEQVAAAASFMFLLLYLMVNVSAISIRHRMGDSLAYGFVTPFFPAVPATAIVMQLFLAIFMIPHFREGMIAAFTWIFLGGLFYTLYVRYQDRSKLPAPIIKQARSVTEASESPVLVPIAKLDESQHLIDAGIALADSLDQPLLILHVVKVPQQLPISAAGELAEPAVEKLEKLTEKAREQGVEAELLVRVAHKPSIAIDRTVKDRRVDFCVLGWRGRSSGRDRVMGSTIDPLLRETNCNYVVMQKPRGELERILVPVANPDQATLSLAVAIALGKQADGVDIDVVRVFDEETEAQIVEQTMTDLGEALAEVTGSFLDPDAEETQLGDTNIDLRAEFADSTIKHLTELSGDYDLMIAGAGPGGMVGRPVLGRFTWSLAEKSKCPTMVTKRRAGQLHFQVQQFFQFFRDEEEAADSQK